MKKVKVKRFNFKKFIIFLLFLILIISSVYYLSKVKIKNIIISGNNYISDEQIIETAKLENYPSFLNTMSFTIKKRIKKIPMIKDVEIKKSFNYKVYINVVEYKVLFFIRSTNEYVLDDFSRLSELDTNKNIPVLINYVSEELLTKLINKFSIIDEEVLFKISEIEYSPTDYDELRFFLYMNDGNEVYITLNKIKEFNKYNSIKEQLGNNKGILYLDSGNFFEIKND